MPRGGPIALACPFEDCRSNQSLARAWIITHSRLQTRTGSKRRRLCRNCGRTFSPTTGTVYSRLRRSKSDFDRALQMQSEGMTKAAIARVLHASPSTISRWLSRAGKHARAFHEAHTKMPEPVEFQLDELACKGIGEARNSWAYSGIEVWSRLWVSLKVGRRTLRNTHIFIRQLKDVLGPFGDPCIVTTDAFKYYEPSMRRVFVTVPLVYYQVSGTYRRNRIVRSEKRMVMRTPELYAIASERSEDSRRPSTAYVERQNLRKRMCCSMLRRKTPSPARSPERLEEALELVRAFYNFVHGHSSLRFGKVKCTPAMQAGIFKRPLATREISSWVLSPDRRRRSRVGQAALRCS